MNDSTDVLVLANERFRFASVNPLDLAELLARRGLNVEVAAPISDDALRWNDGRGFSITVLPSESNHTFWMHAINRARSARPRVIIGVNTVGFLAADLAKRFVPSAKTVMYSLELATVQDFPHSLSVRWQNRRARWADLVLATGPERAEAMVAMLNLAKAPSVVLNSPLHQSLPDDLQSDTDPTPPARTLTNVVPIVAYAGSLGPANRIVELVEAFDHLRHPATLRLLAFGGDPSERTRVRTAVERSAHVEFVAPVLGPRGALLTWLREASVGVVLLDQRVNPSLNVKYYTPNKLYDYLAVGLPVVASDNLSLLRSVKQAGLGAVANPSEPRSIAAAIDEVLENYETYATNVRREFQTSLVFDVQAAPVVETIAGWCET